MNLKLKYKNNDGSFVEFDGNSITPKQLLGMLIFGEARGASDIFRFNVGVTVLARLARSFFYPSRFGYFGSTIQEIITKKWQYSCFNENDPNFKKIQDPFKYAADDETVEKCFKLAASLVDSFYPIYDSKELLWMMPTHYETLVKNPSWSEKVTYLFKIDNGEFYRED